MSKKMALSLYARSLIIFFFIMLVTFSLLSINKYKASYYHQKNQLSEVRLSSQRLHSRLFEVRGGFVVDYDGLVEAIATLNHLLKSLASENPTDQRFEDAVSKFLDNSLLGQEHIKIPNYHLP